MISVDYTLTTNKDWIKEKFYKHYQAEDRLLIIVLVGEKNPRDVKALRDMLTSLKRRDKSHNLENIRILTSDEYNKFLGINRVVYEGTLLDNIDNYKYSLKYSNIEYWTSAAYRERDAYDEAMKNWDLSLGYLSTISTDWINRYLPQN
ncbi:hypothetical protein LCGC14_1970050 [marine sediment metagenome]|uniref:Uncharacterized protein n=1 Tax=marine sediment metagenome TaxID=412755 RepID=A0A0F9HQC5_9ZZZZ